MSDPGTLDTLLASSGAPAEALRALRSRLGLRWFNGEPAQRMLAVVSAERGEGRSFIAANLAIAMAQLGKRTLLIDADLRNPSQHRRFGLSSNAGLAAMLAHGAGQEAIASIGALPALCVLPAGAAPSHAADLLGRPEFRQGLLDLSARFEAVVVDTPAANESADAQIIAAAAKAALIVARSHVSRLARVRALADMLARGETAVVGAVLNDA